MNHFRQNIPMPYVPQTGNLNYGYTNPYTNQGFNHEHQNQYYAQNIYGFGNQFNRIIK